jgi:hypothetical protein
MVRREATTPTTLLSLSQAGEHAKLRTGMPFEGLLNRRGLGMRVESEQGKCFGNVLEPSLRLGKGKGFYICYSVANSAYFVLRSYGHVLEVFSFWA